ncbi:hypothetical protein RB195_007656 [Necator americanus]
MLITLALFAFTVALANEGENVDPATLTGHALADYLRKHQTFFKVKESPEADLRMKFVMDSRFMTIPSDKDRKEVELDEEPPERFDARDKWPDCVSIGTIRDQSFCGSCWAVSAAEVMSDRLCIQSGGRIKLELSDTDILACCGFQCGSGCEGGYPLQAWRYVMEKGVCTGGRYRQKGVCKPYSFHPCGFKPGQTYYGDCPRKTWETPKCDKFCRRGYVTPYEKDKYYAISAYVLPNDEKVIRREIMKNGPVQAAYFTYEDFKLYDGGIYVQKAGKRTGGHAVKIIGWGEEKGVKYWLIANSWNVLWGEEGYFRMIRGTNNCSLEEMIYAGMMKVD